MHSIDTGYEAMMEAVVEAHAEKRSRLWVVSAAWHLFRRNAYSGQTYWGQIAAKLTEGLNDYDFARMEENLSKPEIALVNDAPEAWPVVPEMLQVVFDRWNPPQAEIDLDAYRSEATRTIDNSAEAFRLNFITPGSGQAMAYQQKLEEARAFALDNSISPNSIPHLVVEATAEGVTVSVKVAEILGMFAQWQQVSAQIEGLRMSAKIAVAEATTVASIRAAALVNWASLLGPVPE